MSVRAPAILCFISILAAPLLAFGQTEGDGEVSIVFPDVESGKAKLPRGIKSKVAKGFMSVFDAKYRFIRKGVVLDAAKSTGAEPGSTIVAEKLGASYTLTLKVLARRSSKRYVLRALLRKVDGTTVLELPSKRFKKKSATKVSKAMGRRFLAAIEEDRSAEMITLNSPDEFAEDPPETDQTVIAPLPEEPMDEEPIVAAPPPVEQIPVVEETKPTPAKRNNNTAQETKRPEKSLLKFKLGAGSRAYAAYAVVAQGNTLGNSFTVDPTVTINVQAAAELPMGLGLETGYSLSPTSFSLDSVQGAIEPREPGGTFHEVFANLYWRLDVARLGQNSWFTISPLLGVDFGSLIVDQQSPNLVLSWSTLSPLGGVRFGLEFDKLALDLGVSGGIVVAFEEDPGQTGEFDSGVAFNIGSSGRYYFNKYLGAELAVRYRYRDVTLKGPGTRVILNADQSILNAGSSVQFENLDVLANLVITL